MTRRAAFLLGVTALVGACAIPEPPPGGPEDKTPPTVEGTVPANGEAAVPRDVELRVQFSESMQRQRFERFLAFHPPAEVEKVRWDGETARVRLAALLHADTTYVVEVEAGFSDAHGVRSETGFRFAFATSARIDSGAIAGRVLFRREPSDQALVRLFALPRDSGFAVEATRPDREVKSGKDGTFKLDYLPTNRRPMIVWAFHDANGNGSFDRDSEAGLAPADTIALDAGRPRLSDVVMAIVDPREPGTVAGTVRDSTGVDTVRVSIAAHALLDTMPPTYYGYADAEGKFEVELLRGRYVLYAFHDYAADSLCGAYPCPADTTQRCLEPCVVFPDTIDVEPGSRVDLDPMELRAQ